MKTPSPKVKPQQTKGARMMNRTNPNQKETAWGPRTKNQEPATATKGVRAMNKNSFFATTVLQVLVVFILLGTTSILSAAPILSDDISGQTLTGTYDVDATSGAANVTGNATLSDTVTLNQGFFVEYLIVGGGGGGGMGNQAGSGGGGGGGGFVTNEGASPQQVSATNYSIVVGAGGAGAPSNTALASNGGNSSAFGLTALGGGRAGGGANGIGGNGGSGGAASADTGVNISGGTGLQPSSASGGFGTNGGSSSYYASGGGGGAATQGQDGAVGQGGNGGDGKESTITGASAYYAGGGGGHSTSGARGEGGIGGGGNGMLGWFAPGGSAGQANTGGGGGGACPDSSQYLPAGYRGGSGIVVVRYKGDLLTGLSTAGTGSITPTSFTGNGTIGESGQLYQVLSFTIGSSTSSGTFSFDTSGVDFSQRLGATISGDLDGDGSLVYEGPGTLTLAGANTYTGSTTVNAGTLIVDGSLSGTSSILLASGARLGGDGTIAGTMTVENGAILTPGNSPGTTTYTSDQIWGEGGIYEWEIQDWTGSAGAIDGWDLISITDTESDPNLTITATAENPFIIEITEFSLTNFAVSTLEQTFEILSADGGISGFDASYFTLDTTAWTQGGTWGIIQDGNSLKLTYIPEPASLVLLGLGAVALLHRRRR
jgi:autotransporter-associated beta strand protein